jgi:adenylylsulfate kinase
MTGAVVWFTGLPSSGKTTLARSVAAELERGGLCPCLLDGDEVRAALVPAPGYDPAARDDFYATLGNLAALLAGQGRVILVAATAHRRAHREGARAAAPRFLEVHVATGLAECERRDAKGLYARARAGELASVPGVSEPYEAPEAPEVVAPRGDDPGAAAAVARAVRAMVGV